MPTNILIIETAFPGDVVLSLALAEEAKRLFPESRITYLVRPDVAELVGVAPAVDRVIVFDKRGEESGIKGIRSKTAELNALGFDTLFLLHASKRSRELAKQLSIPVKIGFARETDDVMTHNVERDSHLHRSAQAISLLNALSSEVRIETQPRLQPPAIDTPLDSTLSWIALAPGSVWATKKWGDEKFVELSTMLVASGYGVIVVGGPADAEVGSRIERESPSGFVHNTAGKTSLVEAASWIQRADVLVANDSAPVHIAAAVGTYSVAIFGPTIPAFGFAPQPAVGEVVELTDLWCRPCDSHGGDVCPLYDHRCMKDISVESVLTRVRMAMDRNARLHTTA